MPHYEVTVLLETDTLPQAVAAVLYPAGESMDPDPIGIKAVEVYIEDEI